MSSKISLSSSLSKWYQSFSKRLHPGDQTDTQRILGVSVIENQVKMATSKYEIEKFDGKNGFGLWKLKTVTPLENFGLDETLQDE